MRAVLPVAMSLASFVIARPALAESNKKFTDGVYGRFDGDFDLSIAAGGSITKGASGGAAMVRAFFLHTAGIYGAYTDAFAETSRVPARTLALGLSLRPLFLPRWAYDLDRGPAILDLTLDSITFDLGVLWPATERGRFSRQPGMELGLGTEVPLIGTASGPWIGARGALRWHASELSGASELDPPLKPSLFLTLAWHFVANTHVVDVGDDVLR